MSGPTRGRDGAAAVHRRDRWRTQSKTASGRRPDSRVRRRVGWTLASGAALLGLIVLVVLSLFSRRTAVVLLSIDDYEQGLIAPVPFGPRDCAQLEAALAGRLTPWIGANRGPLSLEGFQTAQAMRSELGKTMRGMRLGGRDAIVAVVRGQTLVAEGPDGRPQACLLAEDVNLDRPVPAELVPCRELFSALASSPARTTLIVLDMGDLRWDPRLAVAAGLVPTVLDEECREPLPKPTGECWVLGSHDVHEFSGVSLEDRRGLFLRAVELALAGRADERGWGGDGDGVVELHETARFVAAWTSGWAKRESAGDFDQRPVLWKLGSGRVSLADPVAKDVPLILAGAPRPPPTAAILAAAAAPQEPAAAQEPVAAQEQPAKPGPTESEAAPRAQPQEKSAGAVRPGVWDFIAQLSDRDAAGASPGESCPVDYAPHLWRETVAAAAAAAATPRDDSPRAARANRIETLLETELESFLLGDRGQGRLDGRETPLARLADSRRQAATGVAVAWRNGDEAIRAALAARNRGVELAAAAVDYFGTSSGSTISRPLVRSLPPLFDSIAGLHAELSRLAAASGDVPTDNLGRLVAAVEGAERRVHQDIDAAADELVQRVDRGSAPLPAAELRWFSASRLPTADQRRRLARVTASRLREPATKQPQPPPNDAAGAKPEADRPEQQERPPRLALEGLTPAVPADRGPSARATRDDMNWKNVGDRLDLAMRLLTVFGPNPAFQESDQKVKAFREAAAAAGASGGESALAASAAAAGRALAMALARMPGDVDRLLRASSVTASRSGDPGMIVDALLRLADPRDADRIPSDAVGWVPKVRVAVPLRLALTATDEPLEIGRSRRVSVALQSGAVFPADGQLSLEFDPERLRIRTLGGTEIRPRSPLAVKDLPDRTRLQLLVEPHRQSAAGDTDRMATVRAELAVGARRDTGEKRFQLPAIERLVVAVRGRTGTVEGGDEQPGGWRRQPVDPLVKLDDASVGDAAASAGSVSSPGGRLRLRPFPGQTTAWELAVSNQSGERRAVDVDLISVGHSAPWKSAASPADADAVWQAVVSSLERGLPLPATGRVIATAGPVLLPASEDRVTVLLPAPRPPEEKAATDSPVPIGPTLALVIRDRATGPATATEGEPAADPPPSVRPPEKRRTWVLRLPLSPKRPKSYLSASATWSIDNRSIDITVAPLHGDPSLLPAAEVVLRATQLPRAEPTGAEPVLRIMQATLSGARAKAVLRADWNGGEGRPAECGIDVDGYPRAFVFRVDTRPVMDGVEQRPQRDWRHLSFLRPAQDHQAYRPGSDAAVPLGLAVDVPEDMLGGGTPPLDVVLREVRQRSSGVAADAARPAWSTSMDRQADYAATTASAPSAFAVRTVVGDWDFPLPTPGFTDVDAVIEARLRLPDSQLPDIAKRVVVFDATPPRATVPPQTRAEKGKLATIDVDCEDGDRNAPQVDGRRPGASGVVKAEWAIDAKRNGQPDGWQAVRVDGDGRFKLRVPTEALNIGSHAILVRVTDGVGLTSDDRRCELEVVEAAPPDPAGQ